AVELGLGQPRVGAQALDQLLDRAADVLEVGGDAAGMQVAGAARRVAADLQLALDRDAERALLDRLSALHALGAASRGVIGVGVPGGLGGGLLIGLLQGGVELGAVRHLAG